MMWTQLLIICYRPASLSIDPAFRASACTDCEYASMKHHRPASSERRVNGQRRWALIAELYSADRLLANNAKKGTTTFKSKGKGISIGNSIGSSSVSDDSGSGGWKSSSDGSSVSSSGSSSGSVDGGSGNEDDEGNGDPHFIVTSHDQYQTKLCYDVNGNDGDVLLLLRDQEKKLEINGKIYQRRNMKHPQAFFNNIAVFYGDVKVIASLTSITINDEDSFTWTDSFTAPLSDDVEASVSSGRVPVVEVDLSSDIQLEITRTKTAEEDYFLGIMITNSNGLSDQTTGIIGDFLKSSFKAVTLDNSNYFLEFLDRSLTIPVQKVKRYSRVSQGQVDCWHYTVNTREMQDDLLGDRESYTVPTLNHKPF